MLFPDGNSAVRLESRGNPGMEVSQSWTSTIWGNLGANTSDGQAVVTHTTRMMTQNSHSHGGGQPLYLDQHLPSLHLPHPPFTSGGTDASSSSSEYHHASTKGVGVMTSSARPSPFVYHKYAQNHATINPSVLSSRESPTIP